MAKSYKEKLEALAAKRLRAEKALEDCRQEEEALVAPLKGKIVNVVGGAAERILKEKMSELDLLDVSSPEFHKAVEAALRGWFGDGGQFAGRP